MTYGQPFATCSVCRQPFALTKGGNLYPHKRPLMNGGTIRCPGSGHRPLMDHRMGVGTR